MADSAGHLLFSVSRFSFSSFRFLLLDIAPLGLAKVAFLAALEYSGKLPGPAIIVAPATVLKQWASHFEQWWPRFYVRILHHSSHSMETPDNQHRRRAASSAPDAKALVRSVSNSGRPGILVTSYEQVRKHQQILLDKFEYVVLDEGHKIRNPDADVTLVCKRFQTPRRLLLTGTPMQNNLKELWSLFDFVFPGRLGTLVVCAVLLAFRRLVPLRC